MTCAEARPHIVALADGELAEHDAVRVREHLALCDTCRMVANEYSTVLSAADAAAREPGRVHILSVQLAVALDDLAQLRSEVRALAAEVAAARTPTQEARPRGIGLVAGGQQSLRWASLGIV